MRFSRSGRFGPFEDTRRKRLALARKQREVSAARRDHRRAAAGRRCRDGSARHGLGAMAARDEGPACRRVAARTGPARRLRPQRPRHPAAALALGAIPGDPRVPPADAAQLRYRPDRSRQSAVDLPRTRFRQRRRRRDRAAVTRAARTARRGGSLAAVLSGAGR